MNLSRFSYYLKINYVLDWNTSRGDIDKQINFTLNLNKQNSCGLFTNHDQPKRTYFVKDCVG